MSLFKIILSIKGYKLRKASEELALIHAKSRDEFVNWQQNKCWEIVKYHYNYNEFYRKFVGAKLPTQWNDLPQMNKAEFQKPIAQLLSKYYNVNNIYIGNTSGSSGKPFFFAKDKFSHAMTWVSIFYYYSKIGIKSNDLQARFYGIPLFGKSKYIEQIKDLTMNRIRFPIFNLGDKNLEEYLKIFINNKIIYTYGYTNSIRHFAVYVTKKSIVLKDVCPTLKCVILTSEMCTELDKQIIETAFGIPVFVEYGASEVGIIAFNEPNGELKVCDETLFVETNEKREILITTFYNKAFPIIRYKIGDMGTIETNEHGTFIKSLMGRSDDLVILPNGKEAAGMTFYYVTRAILEKSSAIKEIYFTQKTIDTFLINYISDNQLADVDKKIIISNIDKMLQPNLNLIFEKTDIIRRKANGKFQVFTSELKKV